MVAKKQIGVVANPRKRMTAVNSGPCVEQKFSDVPHPGTCYMQNSARHVAVWASAALEAKASRAFVIDGSSLLQGRPFLGCRSFF